MNGTSYHAALFLLMGGCSAMSLILLTYFWKLRNGARAGFSTIFAAIALISGFRAWDLANLFFLKFGETQIHERPYVLPLYILLDAGLVVTLVSLTRASSSHEEGR